MSDDIPSAETDNVEAAAAKPAPKRRRKRKGSSGSIKNAAFGAVDLGTNNCRLLVAKPSDAGFRVIDSYSRVVRLGAGLADNGAEFMTRVKAETGLSFEIISPRVESRLAVMGCLSLADMSKDVVLVVDIGGGSSELSWVDVRKLKQGEEHRIHRPPISAWASLPAGVVTLSEAIPEIGNSPEALAERYEAMKSHVRDLIQKAGCETRFTKAFAAGKGHIIGTSGTITSLAGIHLGLPYYQRNKVDGLWMNAQHAINISRRMASLPADERAKEPCIGQDRASLLVAGCAIMDVLLDMWPAQRIRVADRGLREGMLMGLMSQGRQVKRDSGAAEKGKSDE